MPKTSQGCLKSSILIAYFPWTSYFSSAVRHLTSMSPLQFRKQMQPGAHARYQGARILARLESTNPAEGF